jgi:dihydrofolate reductase
MLIYSMSVSVDGFIADREGGFEWTAPSEELSLSRIEGSVSHTSIAS